MINLLQRICELQPLYSADNTPEMQERGQLIRRDLVNEFRALSTPLSHALGNFGDDFHVDASDGMGSKTELPWVRFSSRKMSPTAREGFYCVIHFSTDGSAVHITVGCGSSQFQNGSLVVLPDDAIDTRTAWARSVIQSTGETLAPFTDPADFGARRALPRSFERATALSKRIAVEQLDHVELESLFIRAAEFLRLIYQASADGRELTPADLDQIDMETAIKPRSNRPSQGYGLSAADRKQVEKQAMALARKWLEQEGFHIRDTSANHPFDYEARRGSEILKIEVKGTTSDNPSAVLMTRNEVELHKSEKGRTGLIIVSKIRLTGEGKDRIAEGGTLEAMLGWDIDKWQLTSTAYRVERVACTSNLI